MKNQVELNQKGIIVTGIDTGVGKTLVSAILTLGLSGVYIKPFQTGTIESDDALWISRFVSPENIMPGFIRTPTPAAPLFVPDIEKKEQHSVFKLPYCEKILIVEGVGGIMVPIDEKTLFLDYIQYCDFPVVIVCKLYLGSINHTLMTVEVLKYYKINISGIVFIESSHNNTIEYISKKTSVPNLGIIPHLDYFSREKFLEIFRMKIDYQYIQECLEN